MDKPMFCGDCKWLERDGGFDGAIGIVRCRVLGDWQNTPHSRERLFAHPDYETHNANNDCRDFVKRWFDPVTAFVILAPIVIIILALLVN